MTALPTPDINPSPISLANAPLLPDNLTGYDGTVSVPRLRLYVLALFASRKGTVQADTEIVLQLSDNELALAAFTQNMNHERHPDAEWENHAESASPIPDDIILKAADLIRGNTVNMTGPVMPEMIPDPFGLPQTTDVSLPDASTVTPPPIPDGDPIVAVPVDTRLSFG